MPLFTSGEISNGIEAAQSELNALQHDETKTVLDIKLSVAEAYISVLRAKRWVEVAESNVNSLTSYVHDVSNFYEQGMVTKNDLLASQVALADARYQLIQVTNNLNIAYAYYNRLLGRPLDQAVTIEDLSVIQVNEDLSDLTAKSLNIRPELLSLSEQSQSLIHQSARLRSSTKPHLSLTGSYAYQQNKYQLYEDVWSAILGLRWDLFDGGVARHNANALVQKAESLNKLRSDTASVIALQVRQAYLDTQETLKRIDVTRDAITQAEENLKVVRNRYREGVGTHTEVLEAESLRTKSYNNFYNATYDAILAKIRLHHAVGDL